MKLAVSMWSYVRAVQSGDMNLIGFVQEAKSIGAFGVELLDFFYKDPVSERDSVKDELVAAGLPCPLFSVANNFAKVSERDRAAQVDKIKFGVDEAAFFGAKTVRVFAGDLSEGLTYGQVFSWVVDGLSEASDYARDRDVRLALENHGQLAGRGSQVCDIVQAVRDKSGHDALGANPDTGNFLLVDQDSEEAVREVAQFAYMCHFKDFGADGSGVFRSLQGNCFKGTVIGEGKVDLEGCVRILTDSGFDGWFSLEYEGHGDPRKEVRISMDNARSIVAKVQESDD